MKYFCTLALFTLTVITKTTHAHKEFTTAGCLAMHNKLRKLHEGTNDVVLDEKLTKSAEESAEFHLYSDTTIVDNRPTRPLPKKRRKRRHIDDDIDENRHIESWDGEIFYPDSTVPKTHGESIHKMCCTSAPHCPKEFFHNLLFPPSAEGVVRDFYDEEIGSYDFASGRKKAQFYTQIKHFTNIVWKKTTKIGCAQSKISDKNCVYTIVHYEVEGSVGTADDFKQNVGDLVTTQEDSKTGMIAAIVICVALFLFLIVVCYMCRDKVREKYFEMKIKTDTMKAEQELETDSTAFWWLKLFKRRRRKTQKKPWQVSTHSRATRNHRSLRDTNVSIEVVHNARPQRSFKQPPRVRGQSNAQSFAIKYQGISQKAQQYNPDEQIYENFKRPAPIEEDVYENSSFHNKPMPPPPPAHASVKREPSLSGKPPPPAIPVPQQRPVAAVKPSVHHTPSTDQQKKPLPSTRSNVNKPLMPPPAAPPPTIASGSVAPPRANPRPTPVPRKLQQHQQEPSESREQSASPSINELRQKLSSQGVGGASAPARSSPPVKAKPMMPPSQRPR